MLRKAAGPGASQALATRNQTARQYPFDGLREREGGLREREGQWSDSCRSIKEPSRAADLGPDELPDHAGADHDVDRRTVGRLRLELAVAVDHLGGVHGLSVDDQPNPVKHDQLLVELDLDLVAVEPAAVTGHCTHDVSSMYELLRYD